MLLTPVPNDIASNVPQPAKAYFPIATTDAGIVIFLNLVQLANV